MNARLFVTTVLFGAVIPGGFAALFISVEAARQNRDPSAATKAAFSLWLTRTERVALDRGRHSFMIRGGETRKLVALFESQGWELFESDRGKYLFVKPQERMSMIVRPFTTHFSIVDTSVERKAEDG